jgi:hypothetical protein
VLGGGWWSGSWSLPRFSDQTMAASLRRMLKKDEGPLIQGPNAPRVLLSFRTSSLLFRTFNTTTIISPSLRPFGWLTAPKE